jgi:LuxR family maltose regulon positive regulatory protein
MERVLFRVKLMPLRTAKRVLIRPSLTQRLLEAVNYRLTIVQAGAGYGKSTALASLANQEIPAVWYQLEHEDSDPITFLLYLIHGFRSLFPQNFELPLALLEEQERQPSLSRVVDIFLDELAGLLSSPCFLILDDAHFLNASPETVRILDYFIARSPPDLHTIISTRYLIQFPSLARWKARGEVLEIRQKDLAFTPDEIASLFEQQYNFPLSPHDIALLSERTEGWPIALQMVWKALQSHVALSVSQALERVTGPAESLFLYLALEVLEQLEPKVRDFLLQTAVLREILAPICDCLRGANDSASIINYLVENNLFIVEVSEGRFRYHHLFREFLYHQLSPQEARQAHFRAAQCFSKRGEELEAVHHFLSAQAWEEAAKILEHLGRDMVQAGRLELLSNWLRMFPPEIFMTYPALLIYMGDIARLRSRFHEALGWYQEAEKHYRLRGDKRGIGQALRGQARVYLDTVDPVQAERYLQEALRIADGQEDKESYARLLELLAENLLNLGRPKEAEKLRAQALTLRKEGPGEAELAVRVLLRTGRLNEARRLLEEQAERERREPILRPRAHRETLLLLSLILAFQGEAEAAYQCALEGTKRGQLLNSPFVTAVGYMRQGHSWLIRDDPQSYSIACQCYKEAIAISEDLTIPRLKVEAFWGLCRAHGFRGELEAAEEAAQQGIEIAQRAGDEWITALIRVSMGAGYALAGEYKKATDCLSKALAAFKECSDPYGEALTRLWLCLIWWRQNDKARLRRDAEELLRLVHNNSYHYLFTKRTLLGPPDPRMAVPILIYARNSGIHQACAESILQTLGLEKVEVHPGYQLRIQTLGPFKVWRGNQEITPSEWRREKAKRLFQLMITYRYTMLDRDQILEFLWPSLDPETAKRNFKVSLSTLCKVLEPERPAGTPSAYIVRDGTRYGLRPNADIWLDVEEMEKEIRQGDKLLNEKPDQALEHYRRALSFYQGDYLEECLYEDWCTEEREKILALYLRTADRMAELLAQKEAWEEVLSICRAILKRDPCWEQAYRWMMLAYARTGRPAQALKVFKKCTERLRKELQVDPSPATMKIYEEIRNNLLR